MLLRRVILSVAVVLALVSPCRSQSFGNEEVEGLCIYKSRISLPDKVATLFEYRTSVEYPSTSYIFPVSRRRIRLSPDAEIHCIPYPGRSDLDKRTAMALLSFEKKRFPQFGEFLHNVEKAWDNFSEKPSASHSASKKRHAQAVENIGKAGAENPESLAARWKQLLPWRRPD